MGTVKGKTPPYHNPDNGIFFIAWTIPGHNGAMWTQTRAVAARTCPTLLPGFLASLGHMRLALHPHVETMVDTTMVGTTMVGITMGDTKMVEATMVVTLTVETTMEDTIMVDTTMEDPAMVDTIMEDPATVDTTMVATIMVDITMGHQAMVDITMGTIVDQIMGITADPPPAEEPNV